MSMLRRRSSTEVQARPGARQGWVQWRAMRRRRQRSRVSGVTSQPARCGRGNAAAMAPSRARSSSASAGRLFWRCRAVSWWRNTMISRSLERPERTAKRANDTSNRYRMRHIGPQDASASCLVSAPDHILGTHTVGRAAHQLQAPAPSPRDIPGIEWPSALIYNRSAVYGRFARNLSGTLFRAICRREQGAGESSIERRGPTETVVHRWPFVTLTDADEVSLHE